MSDPQPIQYDDIVYSRPAPANNLYNGPGLAALVHKLTTPVLLTDEHMRCTYLNLAAEQLIRLSLAEASGQLLPRILREAQADGNPKPFNTVLQLRQRVQGQAFIYPKGARKPVNFLAYPLWEGQRLAGVGIELTEWSEPSYLSTVPEQSPTSIATLRGPDHIFEMANPAYYQLVGHRDIIGKPMREAVPEVIEQGFIDLLDTVYNTGVAYMANNCSVLLQRTPNGLLEKRIVNFSYSPLYEGSEHVAGILVHAIDVTELVRVQNQYAQAQAHYQRLVATSPQMIYAIDANGLFTEINPAGERILGRSRDEIIGHHFRETMSPEAFEIASRIFNNAVTSAPEIIESELQITRPNGESRLIQGSTAAMWEQGQMVGMHGIIRDITEESGRDQQMRLLMMVFEQIEQGVTLLGEDLRFRFINPAAAKLLGISAETPEAYTLSQFIPVDEDPHEQATRFTQLLANAQWSGRVRRRRSDGHVSLFDLVKGVVVGPNGERLYFDLFQDATKAEEQERQLRRAERLASLGTLIGGVAHELNNPLTTIIGMCDMLLLDSHSKQDQTDINTIQHEAKRMARIVSDLRLSARHTQDHELMKQPVSLNDVVHHVLNIRNYTLQTGNITVQKELANDLPLIQGDADQLEQVLLNLIVNAEHAMKNVEGSRQLTIRTLQTAFGTSLQVWDTGAGIAPHQLDRLFDPFFTTKLPGEGIGLGLSLAHSIIQEHGGIIHAESTVGQGARFQIDLPAAKDFTPAPELQYVDAAPRPLRLLVVDDEAPIREMFSRFLMQRGHTVDVASDGSTALKLANQHEYNGIISDIRMPGMSGEKLFKALRERDQLHCLIVVTGDTSNDEIMQKLLAANVPVLLKPVAPAEVARAIELQSERSR